MGEVLSSAHVHTTFCDGKSTAEELAVRACELGFVRLVLHLMHRRLLMRHIVLIHPGKVIIKKK